MQATSPLITQYMITLILERKKFIHDYSLIDWSFLDNSDVSIHDQFNTFYEKTTECINNHIPKKRVSKEGLKLRSKPWINIETQRLMNYRDKLFNNMIKNPSPSNNLFIQEISESCGL